MQTASLAHTPRRSRVALLHAHRAKRIVQVAATAKMADCIGPRLGSGLMMLRVQTGSVLSGGEQPLHATRSFCLLAILRAKFIADFASDDAGFSAIVRSLICFQA